MRWLVLGLLLLAGPATAHEWYDGSCCSGQDCAPAQSIHVFPSGDMQITTEHGTVIIPVTMLRRESKDHQVHACMRQMTEHEAQGGKRHMVPLCIYLPGGT